MFTPHTDAEREEMLRVIGVRKLDDLFADVPIAKRYPKLDLPPALTEIEARLQMEEFAFGNNTAQERACFLGAGAYYHYTPAAVDAIIRRGEFLTAYTPYQPEVSQGTLQAIFEYQSLIANLTGMDVSNASHYDGATATAEAAVMAYHHFRGKRTRIILSPSLNPQYREVVKTYMGGYEGIELAGENLDPLGNPDDLTALLNDNTALLIVQYPDFFGRIYDFTTVIEKAHQFGALVAVAVNPMAMGLLKTPGAMGADIAVGEGQSLGLPLSFGGPYLGIFATKKEYVRKIAGRLVGETADTEGRRGYVLTLTAREQHIRREKATSNICTNQGLMALAATVYMSLLGKNGLKEVATLCYQKAHYAADQISKLDGYEVLATAPFFHEFVVKCPQSVEETNMHLLANGFLGGYDLGNDYPALSGHMLIAVTEMVSKEDIDDLCEALKEVNNG